MEELDKINGIYTGLIRKSESKIIKKAVTAYYNQVYRCRKNNHPQYKNYGAKGIQVEYTIRQFIYWYINNYNTSIKKPSVGRINHDDNYRFDNIQMMECSENSKEVFTRKTNVFTKINKTIANQIREEFNNGEKRKNLSVKYNLDISTIGYIVRNEVWID